MHDVSESVRELKGRYAQWYNRQYKRYGVLWAERFKSVLVESSAREPDAPEALTTMAAYIELSPVRAGLCEDPKEYRYCGYAEAVGGAGKDKRTKARAGLAWILGFGGGESDWGMVSGQYRKLIFGTLLEAIEQGRFRDIGGSAADANHFGNSDEWVRFYSVTPLKLRLGRYHSNQLSMLLVSTCYGDLLNAQFVTPCEMQYRLPTTVATNRLLCH